MNLLLKDKQYIWHPYTQHKTDLDTLEIVWAEGAYLYTDNGKSIFDAISSWWVVLHGHCHPYFAAKITEQLARLDQVMFSGFTHQPAIALAERVLGLLPKSFSKVFYSDNGATAVEAALKMSLQYWHNQGIPKKRIVAFRNGYHGDTFGAMSVSERSLFVRPFEEHLFHVDFIDPPLRNAPPNSSLNQLKDLLAQHKDIAAFIYEPLVQGSGGMLMHNAKELSQLIQLAQENQVICIADEVMTGWGRTGKLFASEFLSPQADIICLAKGLSGGAIPLAMTLCNDKIYNAFLSDDRSKAFLHGHTFSANPVACAASMASLDLLAKKDSIEGRKRIEEHHQHFCAELNKNTQARSWFRDVRMQGTILALEWQSAEASGYYSGFRDKLYRHFLDRGVLLRPLGNVTYVLPPYCSATQDLDAVYTAIMDFGKLHFG